MDLDLRLAILVGEILMPDMIQPLAQGRSALPHHAAQADMLVALVEVALQPVVLVADMMHRQHPEALRLQPAFQLLLIGIGVLGIANRIEIGGDLDDVLMANDELGIVPEIDFDAPG